MPKKQRKYIKIRGANEHNLKCIDVDIPRDEFVVLTGLSGSGKSSLAFGNRNHCFSRFDCFYQTFFIYCCDLRIG